MTPHPHAAAVEDALRALDLDAKTRLLAGQDMWTLPALPQIGLRSLVMSDGPIGVRGLAWGAEDPSIALPSPTALAATWDPGLARRAGRLLAQEARRKGVHVLLAPTVNLHRSPLGGRHFEAYSEDPLLTGVIGTGYVRGVQDGGVGTTVKHFVANDAETDRLTVDNRVSDRALRELYLAPFEAIVRDARPWGVMTAYNQVNGVTMTEHRDLVQGVLRGEWDFDGANVSDWTAARDTVGALRGGLDLAMPGPRTVYGPALAEAVREGRVEEAEVDEAVRRVLLLAARTGALEGVAPAVDPAEVPAGIDGRALAREIASRAMVLVRNEPVAATASSATPLLPLDVRSLRSVAVIGAAARDARVLGGGSATVFPEAVVSPLEGLRAALPEGVEVVFATGADARVRTPVAREGFTLTARYLDADGAVLTEQPLFDGHVQAIGGFPDGVGFHTLHAVELTGTFTPAVDGRHTLALAGSGTLRLTLDGRVLFDEEVLPATDDPFELFMNPSEVTLETDLTAGRSVDVTVRYVPISLGLGEDLPALALRLGHREPHLDPDGELEEAARVAAGADVAVVVVGTTEETESEGADRTTLALPGRQDELVRRVAAANPRTVVVVNSGSPVELPWREDVPAVLLSWFPGQEAGAALADVLLGIEEPAGRLPTTWPGTLADAPVSRVVPEDGTLPYAEDLFVGYRAWDRATTAPAYPFGHGTGYTTWSYDALSAGASQVTVTLTNTGERRGRETVQVYLRSPAAGDDRPARALAGFAVVEASPGESVEAVVDLQPRAYQVWDEKEHGWRTVAGTYRVEVGHSSADLRLTGEVVAP
ncbi:glycoside hydrolase family 3 protein [Streptomyces sp. NPDC059740]|uniref:glycoside hydrolase family 3 protein n=1 Tax=Streptomyces sp. NPDC059740 TaxID=3346926 RepID=UPI00366160B7